MARALRENEAAAKERRAAAEERMAAAEDRLAGAEDRMAAAEDRIAAAEERHHNEMADIRTELRRAIQLSVREARQERSKRRAIDDKITQLAAAQLVTEEKLQRLLDARHGNGKP